MSEFVHKPRRAGGIAGEFTPIDGNEHPWHDTEKRKEQREQAKICLNCTKPKCTGTSQCFKHEKEVQGK